MGKAAPMTNTSGTRFYNARRRELERKLRAERVTIGEARRLAEIIKEQEQAERFEYNGAPDEWAPFITEAQADGGDAGDVGETDQPARPLYEGYEMLFSATVERNAEGVPIYRRDFANVRDFCEQPFAKQQNEQLFLDEENGGEFDDYDSSEAQERLHTNRSNMLWYGADSAREAMDRAFKGWPEGAERVRSLMEAIDAPPPVDMRRKLRRADQGDEVDVHAVYRGDLDHAWSSRRRQHARARMSVRLVAELGGHKQLTADDLFWRGAAVAKLAELLSEGGYRVEVLATVCHNCDWREGEHEFQVLQTMVVKQAAAPMDLEQVAGVMCNAGFFRTYCFRNAYAGAEHVVRQAIREPKMTLEYLGRGRNATVRQVPVTDPETGRPVVLVKRLLARTSVMDMSAQDLGLDADGTLTLQAPADLRSAEKARAWVLECLQALEQGNTM